MASETPVSHDGTAMKKKKNKQTEWASIAPCGIFRLDLSGHGQNDCVLLGTEDANLRNG
jgi:hypothetical protein